MDLDVSLRSLQNWETDTNKPPAHTVKMLMNYYRLS
jgi:DNA-binding transcriptional regulator YiaG